MREDIRGDSILWLDEYESTAVHEFLATDIAALQQAFNAAGYLGLHEFEGQFAVYPPGARYARHLDRFRDHDARVISLVLYLNADWNSADGGELCLYPGADTVTVLPATGTLVGFLSAEVPHEVRPARRERFSLSGWFRRRA
ncbi:MAG TPA: 2OG-Fe(II) oxygenase [Gammaproteobacteria bacterium]|nr:2OG-Fe(II) oxygenase [Gammaproteobacteria bacterium]